MGNDLDSPASRRYQATLTARQEQFRQQLSAAANRPITFLNQYQLAFNGVSVSLSQTELALAQSWAEVVLARPRSSAEVVCHKNQRRASIVHATKRVNCKPCWAAYMTEIFSQDFKTMI
jgi:hypothetical protein